MIVRIPKIVPAASGWASMFGVDRHGVFSGIRVGDAEQLLRWIEPGSFLMGAPSEERGSWSGERPEHTVAIPHAFWLGETPVTQEFYKAVIGDNPSRFQDDPRHPVENVSWQDATAFCKKLTALLAEFDDTTARLPSEAEWEYACRAGTTAALYSGKPLTSEDGACPNLDELAWYNENSKGTTHPVGEKRPNAWGLHDMLGNVWEWCQDVWHDSYEGAPDDGRAWMDEPAEGSPRVDRGGSWAGIARFCRCGYRLGWRPGSRLENLGFRFVLAATFNEDKRSFS